jgi:exopolyphosphatase/guanosine-5'-triphosphate,3'-diphosphate pyrophosphatase
MRMETRLAAVDLGSNSFRLEVGCFKNGAFERTEYLKETVRQGSGLDDECNLSPQAMQNGWDCLARFAERLAGFKPTEVRAVATQTLREARNRDIFLAQANRVLGFPIHVVSGREEARLIYQGVAHLLPQSPERRLVIDVGGRSTELILGQGLVPQVMESFTVGSIAWSKRYFADGRFTPASFAMAEVAAKAALGNALQVYRPDRWDLAYGSAGTVSAIGDVLVAAGWPAGEVSQDGLDWILQQLLEAQSADRLTIAGMREDRKAIIGGGVSVMRALFSLLSITSLQQAAGGLRHGLICDLLGATETRNDLREKSVLHLANAFNADPVHAQRVTTVALHLFDQLADPNQEHAQVRRRELRWATTLHEIGHHISHTDHHKHGAYILDNADAMGFSLSDMHRLGLLVLGQHGKLRKVQDHLQDAAFSLQLMCLRLAIILCHARAEPELVGIRLQRAVNAPTNINLRCCKGWSQAHPQSAHLLQEESIAWQKTPWTLAILAD